MKLYAIYQSCPLLNIVNDFIAQYTDINQAHNYLDYYNQYRCQSCVYIIKEYFEIPNDKSSMPGAISQGKPLCCVEGYCEKDKLGLFDRSSLKLKNLLNLIESFVKD